MEAARLVLLIIVSGLMIGQTCCFSSSSSSSSLSVSLTSDDVETFQVYAQKRVVVAGSKAVIICNFPRQLSCQDLHWYHGPTMLFQCSNIMSNARHFSVKYIDKHAISKLIISNTRPEDSGEYSCGLSRDQDDKSEASGFVSTPSQPYAEGSTTLTVLNGTETPPICKPVRASRVGQTVSLTCSPPRGSYHALLVWYTGALKVLKGPQLTKSDDLFTFTKTLRESDNFKNFTCLVSAGKHPTDLTKPSCSLTPLKVDFIVAISPHVAHTSNGQPADFSCVTQSASNVTHYQWYALVRGKIKTVNPDCSSCRYKILDGGKMLQIPQVAASEDNGLRVKCKASNTGQETAYSHWSLLSVNDTQSEKFRDDNAVSHSHAPFTIIGVLVSVGLSAAALAGVYYILKKKMTKGPNIPQQVNTDSQRYQGLPMKTLLSPGEPPAGRHEGNPSEMAYDIPRPQPQSHGRPESTGDNPPDLPAKEGHYELVNMEVQHQGTTACKTSVDDGKLYEIPRPQQV